MSPPDFDFTDALSGSKRPGQLVLTEEITKHVTVTRPSELTAIIDDLKRRQLSAHVTGVRITPQAEGLAVGGQILGQQTAADIRRCCDEVSRHYGIDIFVTCTMF